MGDWLRGHPLSAKPQPAGSGSCTGPSIKSGFFPFQEKFARTAGTELRAGTRCQKSTGTSAASSFRQVSHLSNISFRFIEGEGLLINLDLEGVAVSTGSACSSGTLEPSPVTRALGLNDELARGSIRFSFGKDNTEADVDYVLEVLSRAVERLRALSPMTLVSHR